MKVGNEGYRKAKIVCTLGPATADRARLAALCEAGMDVARLNMSHGSADETREMARMVREISAESGRPLAVLVDLQGPKIRLGDLPGERELKSNDRVVLAPQAEATGQELPVTYTDLARDVAPGDRLLLNDGRVELRVVEVSPPRIEAEVAVGGVVGSGKGINLPGVRISAPALTEKDVRDLELAEEIAADYVALSFVRSADNLRELRERISGPALVLAKIETASALDELDGILEAADAVMVARGDLGAELPFEEVPLTQKRIVRKANTRHRPVIIATEMLETMIERPRPTRAEVSDVANAILDGGDAVMLSAETAIGKHPLDAVDALDRVIREIESMRELLEAGPAYDVPAGPAARGPVPTEVAVAGATLEAVRAIGAPAVVTFTKSGFTARVVSSRRPPVPILAVTDTEIVFRQLALVWGVIPVLCADGSSYENMWNAARKELDDRGLAEPGDRIVVTAGVPFHIRGTTNMVRIEAL